MAQIKLKNYQEKTLEVLGLYLEQARFNDAKAAYETVLRGHLDMDKFRPYQSLPVAGVENVPYICLRLPTGGGKTLLSAHTIRLAAESYIENDYPVALWFVPSDAIKTQTLETLKNPSKINTSPLPCSVSVRSDMATVTSVFSI